MSHAVIAVIIFALVMVLVITEKIPRAVAAILGAAFLLVFGVMDVETAASYIDFNTIGVLIGMMLLVAVVKESGLFEYVAVKSAKLSKGDPWKIMVSFMIITALLSCLLDNVTTVLLIGPMTFAITKALKINPVPFVMTQILASNIGGTATLIGDPPNIMIGSSAGLSFMSFIVHNGPVIVVIMIATIIAFRFMYKKQLTTDVEAIKSVMAMDENKMIKNKALLIKSIVVIILTVIGFVLHGAIGIETAVVALVAAVVMIIIGRQKFEDTLVDVEWSTIIFFIGLFIVVGGMVETGVIGALAELILGVTQGRTIMTMLIILWVSALLSSTVDNIPFVATMIPLIGAMGAGGMAVEPLWWALSLGACLGGNGTIIGASANVVLTGISRKHGHPITYVQFLKVGFPMMILSIVISTVYLLILFR